MTYQQPDFVEHFFVSGFGGILQITFPSFPSFEDGQHCLVSSQLRTWLAGDMWISILKSEVLLASSITASHSCLVSPWIFYIIYKMIKYMKITILSCIVLCWIFHISEHCFFYDWLRNPQQQKTLNNRTPPPPPENLW